MTKKVMMVCTGNICRSAMAEAVLREAVEQQGIHDIVVDSCGISDEEHGNPIDYRAAQILREYGHEAPRDHHAKQVRPSDFHNFDLMLAMTTGHYNALKRMQERVGGKARIQMYREYDPQVHGYERLRELDVPDPWYGGIDDFVDTLRVIERVTPNLIAALEAE